jgi:serine/threonine protein phosphatase 1
MAAPVDIGAWQPAPFSLGETVFAIGDIQGCAEELAALLGAVTTLAREQRGSRRLIYLGDVIDRGPNTISALRLWAEDAAAHGVDRVDRIIGNHEIVMLLAMAGGPHAAEAEAKWLNMGGRKALEEMRRAVGDPNAKPSYQLGAVAFGEEVMRLLLIQRGHLRIGNTLFVHGGLDGQADQKAFLAPPWTAFTDAGWAWINKGFLDWQGGFGGTLVVHGHTPPTKHWPLTHMPDPHLFLHDRLGLDGGSTVTGFVVGAELQDGRYRILKAGAPLSTSRNAAP